MTDRKLDRLVPGDWQHVDKYPLSAEQAATIGPTPVVIGINWYSNFDDPVYKDNHYWIGLDSKNLGTMEGGHCVALKHRYGTDLTSWWEYYDQGNEGRCVQFGCSRLMSLMNRKQYEIRADDPEGRWLYYEAQRVDEWPGGEYPGAQPQYEGTSVRAGLGVLKSKGIIPKYASKPVLAEGISAYRWIRSMSDLSDVLGYSGIPYVDLINSWGRGYPHLVRVPLETIERLWNEDGEIGVPTDR